MTPEQLEEIEARAKAATQGEWHDIDGGGDISDRPAHVVCRASSGTPWFICDMQDDLGDPPEGWEETSVGPGGDPIANAAHIAGMDPATTLALTAALRQAWKENERMREALEDLTVACEEEFTSDDTEKGRAACSDNDAVSSGVDGDGAIKFGMIRKARTALKEPTHDQD